MSGTNNELQGRVWKFFCDTKPELLSFAKDDAAPGDVARGEFSLFFDEHARLLSQLASGMIEDGERIAADFDAAAGEANIAPAGYDASGVSNGTDAALQKVLARCEEIGRDQNPEVAEYALLLFLTHFSSSQVYEVPPLAVRAPYKVLPSGGANEKSGGRGSTQPEDRLDWFREDPMFNEHHEHWHIVYPFAGLLGRARDRQGEMFLYMHQQMVARYDSERLAVGLSRVEAFDRFLQPMPSGYEPGDFVSAAFPYHATRPAGLRLADIDRPMYGFPGSFRYSVAEHILIQKRLEEAIDSGFLITPDGNRLAIDTNSLGHTIEASNVENINKSFYGSFHNNGHRLIAVCHDPDGAKGEPLGVMARPETSFRDPIFFRWHKTIDNLSVGWQAKQEPYDFSDAPHIVLRRGVDPEGDPWSPEIMMCDRAEVDALRGTGMTMGDIANGAFGGANWRKDFTNGAAEWIGADGSPRRLPATDTIRTQMHEDVIAYGGKEYPYRYLNHKPVTFFFRIQNSLPSPKDVTVRLFLVAAEESGDRRMFLELDKFRHRLDSRTNAHNVIWRHDEQSSIIRKPAIKNPGQYSRTYDPSFGGWVLAPVPAYVKPPDRETNEKLRDALFRYHDSITEYRSTRFGAEGDFERIECALIRARLELETNLTGELLEHFEMLLGDYFAVLSTFNFDRAYCGCGYPYNLLFPRGTKEGMRFHLWMVVTDWELDRVDDECGCASMSFCGAKEKYPDTRPMGYPFDRPFDGRPESVLAGVRSAAGRGVNIRWVEDKEK